MNLLENYAQNLKQIHEKTYIKMLKKGLSHLRFLYFTLRGYAKFEQDFNQIENSLEIIREMAQSDGVEIDQTCEKIAKLEKNFYNLLDRKRENMFKY
ncbi:hypothetical protein J4225_01115 [Candidatus Pacearchaeota archaeon]|nr:hypothetical protein [Candidatus Pacearchaeota archaeon]